MKKILLILILTVSISSFAQKDKRQERIKALKIAFITERLQLTETEAQKFWPVYNKFQSENELLKDESFQERKNGSPSHHENISEDEAKNILLNVLDLADKRNKLLKEYVTDLLKIIPAKKIILAMSGEREFRRKMIEEFKERHRGRTTRED